MKKVSLLLAIILIVVGIFSYQAYRNREVLSLTEVNVNVEYGEALDTEFEEYIDIGGLSKKNSDKVLNNTEISFEGETEKGKNYLKIGKYPLVFTFDNENTGETEEKTINVIVTDSVLPEFNDVAEISTIVGFEIDYSLYITASDNVGIKSLTYYDDDVNYETAGSYQIIATATDLAGNVTEKAITIIVK